MTNLENLVSKLNPKFVKTNEPLGKHTVVGIGGPADIWYEAQTTDDFINAIKEAKALDIPVTVIGRGSNTLISDKGIRGLVIRNASKNIQIGEELPVEETEEMQHEAEDTLARWESASTEEGGRTMYDFKDLDYREDGLPRVEVKMDSGVDMSFAINYLITKGITGLQWYSRIPGNAGGWIFNNVHGGTHFINEVVKSVRVLDKNLNVVTLKADELNFGYDQSRFHKSGEIIIDIVFELYKGDKKKAQWVAIEWAKRKAIQPSKSTGCIFANISHKQKEDLKYPTVSVGYIVEHVLNLSGFRVGDAAISLAHHNFIENKGNANATDYLKVIKEIQKRAKEQIGFTFKPEIFFMGFDPQELQDALV